jgi:hypothetical protein
MKNLLHQSIILVTSNYGKSIEIPNNDEFVFTVLLQLIQAPITKQPPDSVAGDLSPHLQETVHIAEHSHKTKSGVVNESIGKNEPDFDHLARRFQLLKK